MKSKTSRTGLLGARSSLPQRICVVLRTVSSRSSIVNRFSPVAGVGSSLQISMLPVSKSILYLPGANFGSPPSCLIALSNPALYSGASSLRSAFPVTVRSISKLSRCPQRVARIVPPPKRHSCGPSWSASSARSMVGPAIRQRLAAGSTSFRRSISPDRCSAPPPPTG